MVAGESHVEGLDPFAHLDVESERVARFFESNPDWDAPTRCEGWNVRDLLGHVAAVETYHLACLDDALGPLFEEATKEGVSGLDSFNDWGVRIRKDRPTADVLEEWRTKNREVRSGMRERGRDGSMSSSIGPYPVGLMACHVASEYATHADDMQVPIPQGEGRDRTAWRLQISLFALEENEKPARLAREGATWNVRAGDKQVTLTDAELVEAVTGRLDRIDPELKDALRALA
jgi:uncharacterized protein (TIGR03083 family)